MRSTEQIERIRSRIEDPYAVENFLTESEVQHLINLYDKLDEQKTHKNTGPVTLDIQHHIDDPVISKMLIDLKKYIGDFEVTAGLFFETDFPHIIHNDDTFELPDVYKGITIPLRLKGQGKSLPKLCFFKQLYFHGPAKFFYGSKDVPTYYNKQVYDYSDVEGTTSEIFIDKHDYLTHLNQSWLTGLSLDSVLDWKPTSALIFDSVRLHCASDFRNLGYTKKLGLSIFTKKPTQ